MPTLISIPSSSLAYLPNDLNVDFLSPRQILHIIPSSLKLTVAGLAREALAVSMSISYESVSFPPVSVHFISSASVLFLFVRGLCPGHTVPINAFRRLLVYFTLILAFCACIWVPSPGSVCPIAFLLFAFFLFAF